MKNLEACPDCGAIPGQPHREGCDVERCSVCGDQRLTCTCYGHDKAFSRWTGFWPGYLESRALGIDLNQLYDRGFDQILFVKPGKRKIIFSLPGLAWLARSWRVHRMILDTKEASD